MFSEHVRNVLSNDAEKQLASTRYFVSLLSGEWHSFDYPLFLCIFGSDFLLVSNPPIQQVIDCGVVPFFLQFLRVDNNAALQVEATRAIEKVTLYGTPDHSKYMIKAGAIPILIGALTSTNEDVRILAAHALGNLAPHELREPVRNVLSNDVEKQLASTQHFVSLLSGEWH